MAKPKRSLISSAVVQSEKFLDMTKAAQCLYIHLMLEADDDGLIGNAKTVIRMSNCKQKDCTELLKNGFILELPGKVYAITHFRAQNIKRSDRYKPTIYREAFNSLALDGETYYIKTGENGNQTSTRPPPAGCQKVSPIEYNKIEYKYNLTETELLQTYNSFCEDLENKGKGYPNEKIDKATAYERWNALYLDLYPEFNKHAYRILGIATLRYLKNYRETNTNEGSVDYTYLCFLSSLYGSKLDRLLPFIEEAKKEARNDLQTIPED